MNSQLIETVEGKTFLLTLSIIPRSASIKRTKKKVFVTEIKIKGTEHIKKMGTRKNLPLNFIQIVERSLMCILVVFSICSFRLNSFTKHIYVMYFFFLFIEFNIDKYLKEIIVLNDF